MGTISGTDVPAAVWYPSQILRIYRTFLSRFLGHLQDFFLFYRRESLIFFLNLNFFLNTTKNPLKTLDLHRARFQQC